MSTAEGLLARVRSAGGVPLIRGDKLIIQCTGDDLPADLLEGLKSAKSEVIALLSGLPPYHCETSKGNESLN